MFNSCFGLNLNSWNKSKAKNKNNYASLALVSLEQRVNPAPMVTPSTASLTNSSPTLIINGSGFDTIAANNIVTLSSGSGTVISSTSTQLTVSFSVQPSAGQLFAVVTNSSGSSAPPVQVASVLGTVSVSFNTATGVLLLQSNANLNENASFQSFQSTGTLAQQKILNFTASPGFSTTFTSVTPNIFVDVFTDGSGTVQVDTRNLAGFSKMIFSGSQGNDTFILGSMNGNVLGDNSSPDFGIEITTSSTQGGGSFGIDSLQIDGAIVLKGAGVFTNDSVSSIIPNLNLEILNFGTSGSISSSGTGSVRLVADGFQSSDILMSQGSFIDIGAGSVYLEAGNTGNLFLNGNAISTEGGAVQLASNVILQSSTAINTGLGDVTSGITFSKTTAGITYLKTIQGVSSSGQNLTLDTTGSISIGDVGNINLSLGSINVGTFSSNAYPLALTMSNVFAKSITSTTQGAFLSTGIINLNYIDGLNIITTSTSLGTVTLGPTSAVASTVITLNNGSVIIKNAGPLQIYGGLSLDGSFTQSGSGLVTLGTNAGASGGVIPQFQMTTSSDSISFASAITLNQGAFISTNVSGALGQGANITFSSSLDGLYPVTFVAGIGNMSLVGKVGSTTPVGSILVNNVNMFTASNSIDANSLTISQASNQVIFNGSQSYNQSAGLNITTSGTFSNITFNQPVNCFGVAQININNSAFLFLNPGANLSAESGSITLGGSGGGNIYIFSNLSTVTNATSGNITVKNPVLLFSSIAITTSNGVVSFENTLNSNSTTTPQNLTLQGLLNQGSFVFSKAVGLTSPLNNIVITSGGDVTFTSTLNAGSFTVNDSQNSILFNNNLTLLGSLTTNVVSDSYALTLLGLNNQIGGTGIFANTGIITLGNNNAASFVFTNGIIESGGAGFLSQGSIVTGSLGGISLESPLTINGNNVGILTIDTGAVSIFNGNVNVQANERLIKNGVGGLRLVSNTGSTFLGTMVINQGNVTFADNFSSMDNLTVSGGSISGAGSVGKVFGLAGSILPGDTVGALTTNNLSLNSLTTLGIGIVTVPSGTNDSLIVNGSVLLNNSVLFVSVTLPATQILSVGNSFTILKNDGTDLINGTFLNQPQGSLYTFGNYTFQISYIGGTGNDVTLTVTNVVSPAVVVVPGVKQTFATAADAGGGPLVTVNYSDGHTSSFFAYGQNFTGGVRIAMGDINGDGVSDLVTATGIGGGPHIKVWDLRTGTPMQVASFFAFESNFTGGLYIACGNLNGDVNPTTGKVYDDIIVGAGPGGGPRITAFAGAQAFAINQSTVLVNFFAYAPEFTGGVTVASADRTGDGLDEIVTGAGFGGGPNVTVFQLQQTAPGQFNQVVIQNFFAFDTLFTGGIYVAGGRFTNSTFDDIFVGTGPGTKATVAVAFGAPSGGIHYLNPFGNFTGGVRVGISSTTLAGTTPNYLMAAAGPGGGPQVNLYDTNFNQVDSLFALNPNVTVGVFANTTIL